VKEIKISGGEDQNNLSVSITDTQNRSKQVIENVKIGGHLINILIDNTRGDDTFMIDQDTRDIVSKSFNMRERATITEIFKE
jgi:hypothetical protein